MSASSSGFPLATALRTAWRKGYGLKDFRHDVMAAFVVSLMALPLSMALSIAVGLPPQHGLYTAIVAGVAVPLLGGSNWQVSGPTAAFVVILAPIVSEHGLHGILWAGLMAGVILLFMGFSGLGKLISYIPYPVTTGFTAGIAVVIATLALNDFLGLGIARLDGSYVHKLELLATSIGNTNPYTLLVGGVTLFLLFTVESIGRIIPGAVIAIVTGTLLAYGLAHVGHDISTLGSQFSYTDILGNRVSGIPPYPPMFELPRTEPGHLMSLPTPLEFRALIFPAFAIAILAALESLLSATVADSMANTRHDPNAELNAIGIGNILSAMAGGIPATGAIARTATNINSGARSPLSSSIHAGLIMLYMMALASLIRYIPMASLAALLIYTAYRMSHYKQFLHVLEIAPRSDVIVLVTCFLLTVFVDMVAGVGIGMVLASLLLIKRMTELTHIEIEGHEEDTSNRTVPKGTMLYRIRGPLFFGTVEKAFDRQMNHERIHRLILDMSSVPFIDMTGLVAIKSLLSSVASEKCAVHIICHKGELEKTLRKKIAAHPMGKYVYLHDVVDAALD